MAIHNQYKFIIDKSFGIDGSISESIPPISEKLQTCSTSENQFVDSKSKNYYYNRTLSRIKYTEIKKFFNLVLSTKNTITNKNNTIEDISKELSFDAQSLKEFIYGKSTWPKNLLGTFTKYITEKDDFLGVSTERCRNDFKNKFNLKITNEENTTDKECDNSSLQQSTESENESDSSIKVEDNLPTYIKLIIISPDNMNSSPNTSTFTTSSKNLSINFQNDILSMENLKLKDFIHKSTIGVESKKSNLNTLFKSIILLFTSINNQGEIPLDKHEKLDNSSLSNSQSSCESHNTTTTATTTTLGYQVSNSSSTTTDQFPLENAILKVMFNSLSEYFKS